MKIVRIRDTVTVLKSKKEFQKDLKACKDEFGGSVLCDRYKEVPVKEPIYFVEMSAKEFQLVNFYIELERRKPITNLELKTEIKSTGLRDSKGRFIKRR